MTDEANHVASNVSMKITLHMFIYAHHYIYSAIYNTVLHLVVIIKKVKLFSIACVREQQQQRFQSISFVGEVIYLFCLMDTV